MKTIALYGKKDARMVEKEKPTAGPGQLVVKIGLCGHLRAPMWSFIRQGAVPPFVQLPMVLGHENVGTVVEVGEGVTDYKVGDQILCGPPSHCAEDCPSCRVGKTNICITVSPAPPASAAPTAATRSICWYGM